MQYHSRRSEQLAEIFRDTQLFIKENEYLRTAQKLSIDNTVFYDAGDDPKLPVSETVAQNEETIRHAPESANAGIAYEQTQAIRSEESFDARTNRQEIRISKDRTFEAAMKLHREFPEGKIGVLNFASAVNPGGGVINGASAQEECLCRCSTLYEVLNQKSLWNQYYSVNRKRHDSMYSDACIYSPDIVICKSDTAMPERLKEEEFVSVDVITCAAPRLEANYEAGKDSELDHELLKLYDRRIRHIMHVADANQIDILVLGAFGCGAFHNDPDLVSKGFLSALTDYLPRFDLVEFAIYCRDSETRNYQVFHENLHAYAMPENGRSGICFNGSDAFESR